MKPSSNTGLRPYRSDKAPSTGAAKKLDSPKAWSACQNLSSPTVRFDRQVNYGDAKGVELVTNEFGSSDLQMIAEKMTGSLLETGIFQGRPTVTIST
eukprot:gene35913-44283_t